MNKLTQNKHLNCIIVVTPAQIADIGNDIPQYDIDSFVAHRERLNAEKTKQDEWYMSEKCPNYFRIQHNVDLYKSMRFEVMNKYGAQLVTNAWLKYYEIYLHYKLIPDDGEFKAFCNAELPGASICALNHVVKTLKPRLTFDWRACSLVLGASRNEQIDALGDHYGVWNRNRDKWLMSVAPTSSNDTAGVVVGDARADAAPGEAGYINNGDATIYDNILDYEARIGPESEYGGTHLYSHDAGIDVSAIDPDSGVSGYNQQEMLDARIHLGCAIAGFATLRRGGHFVAKQYTYFESFTHNLIFIYSALFDKFYLSKPLTSKQFNSEIYLIGVGFRGFDPAVRAVLVDRLINFHSGPFFLRANLPTDALREAERFSRIVFEQQINFLRENIEFYKKYCRVLGGFPKSLDKIKMSKQGEWHRASETKPIRRTDMIPSDKVRDFKS